MSKEVAISYSRHDYVLKQVVSVLDCLKELATDRQIEKIYQRMLRPLGYYNTHYTNNGRRKFYNILECIILDECGIRLVDMSTVNFSFNDK